MEQQARTAQAGVAVELVVAACADRESAQQQIQSLPYGIGVSERAEVAVARLLLATHHHRPRPFVHKRERKKGIAFVVAIADVEARLMTLYERILQQQRFHFGVHRYPIHCFCGRHHLRCARRQQGKVSEIAGKPRLQRLGLAHIDDPPVAVLEVIDARPVGHAACLRASQLRSVAFAACYQLHPAAASEIISFLLWHLLR